MVLFWTMQPRVRIVVVMIVVTVLKVRAVAMHNLFHTFHPSLKVSFASYTNMIGIFTQPPFNQPARVYDYKSEAECDRHVSVFKSCIHSVRDVSPTHGFAALKVTALGNPSK